MNISVHGVVREAHAAVRRVNDAALIVQIEVTEGGAPFEAAVLFGSRMEDHAKAGEAARSLKRGDPAVLVAEGLRWVDDHGRARFVATGQWAVTVKGVLLGPV